MSIAGFGAVLVLVAEMGTWFCPNESEATEALRKCDEVRYDAGEGSVLSRLGENLDGRSFSRVVAPNAGNDAWLPPRLRTRHASDLLEAPDGFIWSSELYPVSRNTGSRIGTAAVTNSTLFAALEVLQM